MDKITAIIVSGATFLNSILIIISFIKTAKKPVDKAIDKRFEKALEPVTDKLKEIKDDIYRLDKNQCMNYLTEFLEDVKNGVEKSDIQIKRATEVYDHYINDLHLNTYIHSSWEKYMGGK